MEDCDKLATCEFFKIYSNDEGKKLALAGFVRMYCKGDKQNVCLRKIVSKELGGSQFVPKNMMPTGKPLSGSNDDGWSAVVREVLRRH